MKNLSFTTPFQGDFDKPKFSFFEWESEDKSFIGKRFIMPHTFTGPNNRQYETVRSIGIHNGFYGEMFEINSESNVYTACVARRRFKTKADAALFYISPYSAPFLDSLRNFSLLTDADCSTKLQDTRRSVTAVEDESADDVFIYKPR